MTENDTSDLGVYLSELYKNLNLISSQLEAIVETDQNDIADLSVDTLDIMEKRFTEWMGSFYNILIYLFCSSVAFLAAIIQVKFRFIPVTMMAIFPLYLWLTFLYSIPEIKVGTRVVLSRKNLTLKKQVQLVRSLFIFFAKQLYENSKRGILISLIYLSFFALVMVDEFLFSIY